MNFVPLFPNSLKPVMRADLRFSFMQVVFQSYRYSSQENGGSISSRVCEVIHYSPHGSLRNPSLSPDPVSDLPHIERKSNIILNDSHRSVSSGYLLFKKNDVLGLSPFK